MCVVFSTYATAEPGTRTRYRSVAVRVRSGVLARRAGQPTHLYSGLFSSSSWMTQFELGGAVRLMSLSWAAFTEQLYMSSLVSIDILILMSWTQVIHD